MKIGKGISKISSDGMRQQIETLQNELFVTDVHFEIYQALLKSWKSHEKEFNFSPRFWEYTFQAHISMAILRLCRIYDTDKETLSLPNFLATAESNLSFFDKNGFREKPLDQKRIDEYKKLCSSANPIVKQLLIWRNNLLAHLNRYHALTNETPFHEKYPLPLPDIKKLILIGFEIVNDCANKCGLECSSDANSTNYPVNDYQIILDLLWHHREKNFKK